MQIVNAFSSVQSSLSFIITSYTDIATWQAITNRLAGFQEELWSAASLARPKGSPPRAALPRQLVRDNQTPQDDRKPAQINFTHGNLGLTVNDLDINLPDGTPLLRGIKTSVNQGEALLVTGPSGTGKSTLLRAIAGLWPFGQGEVGLGPNPMLFLPQRPYLPLGTLAEVIHYPRTHESMESSSIILDALNQAGLQKLTADIDIVDDWSKRLSLGEQQRLAFARLLLIRPALVFLDEATSALDEKSEATLYRMLRESPWRPAIVSVGHRSTLLQFHDRILNLSKHTPTPSKNGASLPSPITQTGPTLFIANPDREWTRP
jgi:putative ATP-binding cassette transporter